MKNCTHCVQTHLLSLVAGLFCCCSCVMQEEQVGGEITFYATNGDLPSTKTELMADGAIYWSASDRIDVFIGNDRYPFTSTNSTPAASVEFKGVLDGVNWDGVNQYVALYPHSEGNTYDGSYASVSLTDSQIAKAGSFSDDLFISMAKSDDFNLIFFNVCGGIKFSVTEPGVKSVTFKGNNSEAIAGTAKIYFDGNGKPAIEEVTNQKSEITLTAPEGTTLEVGKWYYIVCFPAILGNGYKLILTKEDRSFAERSNNNPVTIKRAMWGRFTESDKYLAYNIPNNEIWYTTTDGAAITPKTGNGYSVISNTYENGKGIITFNDELNGIFENAFNNCSNLETIIIPPTIKTIGNSAFSNCSSLTSINIPNGVTGFGDYAFSNCSSLLSVTIPEGTKSIGKGAFQKCASLTQVIIPDSVTRINDWAFYQCTGLLSLTLPNKIESINNYAFASCYELTAVVIPNKVTDIGDYAFSACRSMTSVTIPTGVESIGEGAFCGCSSLTSITLPSGLDEISNSAFCGSGLKSISIPNGVSCLGDAAFAECFDLASISIPNSVTTIDNTAFGNCKSLIFLTLPNGLRRIGKSAFTGSGLITITIPSGVTSIEERTFQNCSSLSSITIPSSITSLGAYAFSGCDNLVLDSIPDGITSIGQGTFMNCSGLTSITIPSSIKSLGNSAFGSCNNLVSVKILATTVPTLGTFAFPGTYPLYVPTASVEAYKTATNWRDYASRIQDMALFGCVDLGLSVKWALCNIGATRPEEYGDYYAWGETEPYYDEGYSQSTSPVWMSGKENGYTWSSYKWCNGNWNSLTKYNDNSSHGLVDYNLFLDLDDDVANKKLGGDWRMPTKDEWRELRSIENCTWTWTTKNGVEGYIVESKINGNSIFLPAGGDRSGAKGVSHLGTIGSYWSSLVNYANGPSYANSCYFRSDNVSADSHSSRCLGFSVRPVKGEIIPVTSIVLGETELTMAPGEWVNIDINIIPSNATYQSTVWTSSNPDVAVAVGERVGSVIALAAGTTTLTAYSEEMSKSTTCTVTVKNPCPTGAVDLGLSVYWAECNLCEDGFVSSPEQYGDYYSWGETEAKSDYSWSSYKFGTRESGPFSKYNTSNSYGTVDNKTVLEEEDDVAHVKLGGSWRMPTDAEWTELRTKCTWTWVTDYNGTGINGRLITATNGNSIFLPAAGRRYDTRFFVVGSNGWYWSSSLDTSSPNYGRFNFYDSVNVLRDHTKRCGGLPVRPVAE